MDITKISQSEEEAMATRPSKVVGNLLLPDPPIPSQVRMSTVPLPPEPVVRVVDGKEVEVNHALEQIGVVEKEINTDGGTSTPIVEEVDVRPKGTITIRVFENSPYEVDFEGKVTGGEVDMAWKAMMREYRQWVARLIKKSEAEKANILGGGQ